MLNVGSIVIRADDVQLQAEFWSNALGYVRSIDRPDFVKLSPPEGGGPNVSIDGMRSEVQLPPRIHLDLYADDQSAEVRRLLALGATEIHWEHRPADADYVILADPEGNRFCVIDTGPRESR
jgi:predicted enzyme related to lactoylglutathione lyase